MKTISQTSERWSEIHKVWFRFISAYIVIYIFPFPTGSILSFIWHPLRLAFKPVIYLVGQDVLHMQNIDITPNGSGDKSYDFILVFIYLALAVLTTIIWSVADRKRPNYERIRYWITVWVRYYLAYYLLMYGCTKFNNGQFPAPSLSRLMQPYGKSSPMGLAWTFFGFSKAYGVFMGISECIGGVLMLFRRTILLGACIATVVVLNIVMVNFCYDVPVKLFSSHLLLLCLYVLGTEGSRLLNLFIFNKPVPPSDLSPVLKSHSLKITRLAVKVIMVAGMIGFSLYSMYQNRSDTGVKPPLYGLYDVQLFVQDHDTIPPLATESARWSKFAIAHPAYAEIRFMDDGDGWVAFKPDTVHKTVIMYPIKDATTQYQLEYKQEGDYLDIYGKFHNYYLYVKMKRSDERNYLLINRGFHWINETPYNR